MKIVKRGELVEPVWKGDCRSCESVLEAKESELKIERYQRDGDIGRGKCPVCENSVIFYPKAS